MKVEVTYGEQDVKDIIMAEHIERIGNAPDGQQWVIEANGSYAWSGFTVTSERIETPDKPEVEVANA